MKNKTVITYNGEEIRARSFRNSNIIGCSLNQDNIFNVLRSFAENNDKTIMSKKEFLKILEIMIPNNGEFYTSNKLEINFSYKEEESDEQLKDRILSSKFDLLNQLCIELGYVLTKPKKEDIMEFNSAFN